MASDPAAPPAASWLGTRFNLFLEEYNALLSTDQNGPDFPKRVETFISFFYHFPVMYCGISHQHQEFKDLMERHFRYFYHGRIYTGDETTVDPMYDKIDDTSGFVQVKGLVFEMPSFRGLKQNVVYEFKDELITCVTFVKLPGDDQESAAHGVHQQDDTAQAGAVPSSATHGRSSQDTPTPGPPNTLQESQQSEAEGESIAPGELVKHPKSDSQGPRDHEHFAIDPSSIVSEEDLLMLRTTGWLPAPEDEFRIPELRMIISFFLTEYNNLTDLYPFNSTLIPQLEQLATKYFALPLNYNGTLLSANQYALSAQNHMLRLPGCKGTLAQPGMSPSTDRAGEQGRISVRIIWWVPTRPKELWQFCTIELDRGRISRITTRVDFEPPAASSAEAALSAARFSEAFDPGDDVGSEEEASGEIQGSGFIDDMFPALSKGELDMVYGRRR